MGTSSLGAPNLPDGHAASGQGSARDSLVQFLARRAGDADGASRFQGALAGVLAEGWRWFETPIGPGSGARMTGVARGGGGGAHPWGPPDWLGVRGREGAVSVKPYHRADRVPDTAWPPRPASLPFSLEPRLAAGWSADGVATTEVYLRAADALPWSRVASAAAALAEAPPPAPPFPVHTRVAGLGMSLRYSEGRLAAVTVVAWAVTLPPEPELEARWAETLDPPEAAAYRAALALGEHAGVAPARRHHAVSWTSTPTGAWVPTACLVAPPEPP